MRRRCCRRHTDDADAYEHYLKGRFHSYKYTAEGWKPAIEYFEKAIEKQPDYALAYAGIRQPADVSGSEFCPPSRRSRRAKAASGQALELDARVGDAYLSQALITFLYEWVASAEQEFSSPSSIRTTPEALSYYAMFLVFAGRVEEAVVLTRKALEQDPLAPLINMNGGWNYFAAGMLEEASAQAAKMMDDPSFYGPYWCREPSI